MTYGDLGAERLLVENVNRDRQERPLRLIENILKGLLDHEPDIPQGGKTIQQANSQQVELY